MRNAHGLTALYSTNLYRSVGLECRHGKRNRSVQSASVSLSGKWCEAGGETDKPRLQTTWKCVSTLLSQRLVAQLLTGPLSALGNNYSISFSTVDHCAFEGRLSL